MSTDCSAPFAKQKRYRDRLRAQGLRPVQLWLPDTSSPGFAEECRRQCQALADDPQERVILAELEVMADTNGWTADALTNTTTPPPVGSGGAPERHDITTSVGRPASDGQGVPSGRAVSPNDLPK